MDVDMTRAPVSSQWVATELQRLYPEGRAVGTLTVHADGAVSARLSFDGRPRAWAATFDTPEEAIAACDAQAEVLLAVAVMSDAPGVQPERRPYDAFAKKEPEDARST